MFSRRPIELIFQSSVVQKPNLILCASMDEARGIRTRLAEVEGL
jgi:hypothetical protein